MKRLLTFFIVTTLCTHFLNAQPTFAPIDTGEVFPQMRALVKDPSILDLEQFFFLRLIRENDSTVLYNPHGTYFLFRVTTGDTTVVDQLSTSVFHGMGFGSAFFKHKGTVYLFGGSGMFNTTTSLIYFDEELREWEQQVIAGEPEDALSIVNQWSFRDTLHVLYGVVGDNNLSYCTISLNTFTCEEVGRFNSADSYELFGSYQNWTYAGERYIIYASFTSQNHISYETFDRSTSEFFKTTFYVPDFYQNGRVWSYTDSSKIYKYIPGTGWESYSIKDKDLEPIRSFRKFYLQEIEKARNQRFLQFALIGIFVALLAIALIRKRRPLHSKLISTVQQHESELRKRRKEVFTKEELDEVFGLTHLNPDSAKVVRSKYIKAVNENGQISIERIRDSEDKRVFNYRVT